MAFKCPSCYQVVDLHIQSIPIQKKVLIEDQKRANLMKSDFEMVTEIQEIKSCNNCTYRGDFEEVEDVPEKKEEEVVEDDRPSKYMKWLKWVDDVKTAAEKADEQTDS